MSTWSVKRSQKAEEGVRHKGGVFIAPVGTWYAYTQEEPASREAIGPYQSRPDLEAALMKKGVGFMDLEN